MKIELDLTRDECLRLVEYIPGLQREMERHKAPIGDRGIEAYEQNKRDQNSEIKAPLEKLFRSCLKEIQKPKE